jgi:hypothetical protein
VRLADNKALHCGDTESRRNGELTVLCDVHKGFHEFVRGASDVDELRREWVSCADAEEKNSRD